MIGANRWFAAAAGNQPAGASAADYRNAGEYSHIAFDTVVQSGAVSYTHLTLPTNSLV